MTVAQAAAQWLKAKRVIAREEPKLKAAAEVLKAHFRKNGKRDYKGEIGYAVSVQRRLDQEKVKQHLGEDLHKFQKTINVEQLSLLK